MNAARAPSGSDPANPGSDPWAEAARAAQRAFDALGLWPAHVAAPLFSTPPGKPSAWWSLPFSRSLAASGARAARWAFPASRANAALLRAAFHDAQGAMAVCDPSAPAALIPRAWAQSSELPLRDALGLPDAHFRFLVCAHELGHLSLAMALAPGESPARRLAGAPGEALPDLALALWPTHPDGGLALVQGQWRSMLAEGFADCCACLAAERAGLGPAGEIARALGAARAVHLGGQGPDFLEEGSRHHDTSPALRRLAASSPSSKDAFERCALASREGLREAILESAATGPMSLGGALARAQGALPPARPRRSSP